MTRKRYRICIAICILVIVACSIFCLYEKSKKKQEFEDGILVERHLEKGREEIHVERHLEKEGDVVA